MKRIGWFTGFVLVVGLCAASACNDKQGQGGDTQTNWLKTCATEDDCGGLECICGYCAQSCSGAADCAGAEVASSCQDATGAAVAALCGAGTPPASVCLAPCGENGECPSGQRCAAGACVPGGDAAGAPEVLDFCRRWVEAQCDYVERCGCGAEAAVACLAEYTPSCEPGGIFDTVALAVAAGDVSYDAGAAEQLLARLERPDPPCVEEVMRNLALTSDETFSWAGAFLGARELGGPCTLPVGFKGGISDCREGVCAPLEGGGGTCIELVGLGAECDASGDGFDGRSARLCFEARPPDTDGEYASAFDSLSCVPEAPGSATRVCARDLDVGEPCGADEACASGRCQSLGVGVGACAEKLADGEPCQVGGDCLNGACAAPGAAGSVCSAPLANGATCLMNEDCASASCQGGFCATALDLAVGASCVGDFECATATCRAGVCVADICGDYLSP